ncbi:MAG: low molecular weight protein tyrosine phosphatase family protein [Pseudomonadota bacterium]
MKKLLFVCSENKLRSPTAEKVFSEFEGIEAIGCGTNNDSETPISGDLIEWADIVFVMEKSHRNKVSKKYKGLLKSKRLVCLNIPDNYDRMQPELIQLLKVKVSRVVRILIAMPMSAYSHKQP